MRNQANQKRWALIVRESIKTGSNKGLKVIKCTLKLGWSITLPNGTTHHAETDKDMIVYVRDF